MLKKRLVIFSILFCMIFTVSCGNSESSDDSTSESTEAVDTSAEDTAETEHTHDEDTEEAEATVGPETTDVLTLTEDEESVLESIGDDINVISDEEYADVVSELVNNTSAYVGSVYQLEGIYSTEEYDTTTPYLYRIMNNDGELTNLGLPIEYVYLEKEIPEGTWVRMTGIISSEETEDGAVSVIFQVIAAEALDEAGQEELTWNGME